MDRIRLNTTGALNRIFVLTLLCGCAALADDPKGGASPRPSDSASEWLERTHHPEIYYLRARPDSKAASPERRELARRILQRWDNGVVEPVRSNWTDVPSGPTWQDQKSLKLYEQHGMEIARWPDKAAQPRPDNAALLYYRAVACRPELDPCTVRITTSMTMHGREPDDRVRTYLGRSLNTLQLMQLASQIPQCDWGLAGDPVGEHTRDTIASLRQLDHLLATHARTLAADGHHRAALENCLAHLRFARHIGDDLQSSPCSPTARTTLRCSAFSMLWRPCRPTERL